MKQILTALISVFIFTITTQAQINIGSNQPPDSSAMLQISGTTKGFLPPRMSHDSMMLISNPAKGLMVFNTTDSTLYMRRDSGWMPLGGNGSGGSNYWVKSSSGLYNNDSSNVGIGTSTPVARLQVVDSSVVFSAAGDVPGTPGNAPISGTGRRMMWYADKAAFRAGYVSAENWDMDSIGSYSFAGGNNTKAIGNYSVAMGSNTVASNDNSMAIGNNSTASGIGSFAAGHSTQSESKYSVAMGSSTIASADNSTAIGNSTTASGNSSVATGYLTQAQGDFSFAAGTGTTASSGFETAIGAYNTSYTPTSTTNWAATDRLFTIGNGISSATSDAMVVLKNGNTGIGTSAPIARLQVTDSSVLFNTAGDVSFAYNETSPISGAGRRMMWLPSKAAFRTGGVYGNLWDIDSIGYYSFATGADVEAKGDYSTAMGYTSTAAGFASAAMGYGTSATGFAAVALGESSVAAGDASMATGSSTAGGYASIALGIGNTAGGESSASFGYNTIANGQYATAFGQQTNANGLGALSAGYSTTASGQYSFASGYVSTASGDQSTTIGTGTTALSGLETVIGAYNTTYTPHSTTGWNGLDRLFTVGNGTSPYLLNDAMVILKNGNIGFGNSSPTDKMDVNGNVGVAGNIAATGSVKGTAFISLSDARFKKDIQPLQYSLDAVMKLQGVSWHWKTAEFTDRGFTKDKQIGFIAQDVEKVVPEVVLTDAKGYKGIDYAKLTAVLTEAVKAQQEEITTLKKEVAAAAKQEQTIDALTKRLSQLEASLAQKPAAEAVAKTESK